MIVEGPSLGHTVGSTTEDWRCCSMSAVVTPMPLSTCCELGCGGICGHIQTLGPGYYPLGWGSGVGNDEAWDIEVHKSIPSTNPIVK